MRELVHESPYHSKKRTGFGGAGEKTADSTTFHEIGCNINVRSMSKWRVSTCHAPALRNLTISPSVVSSKGTPPGPRLPASRGSQAMACRRAATLVSLQEEGRWWHAHLSSGCSFSRRTAILVHGSPQPPSWNTGTLQNDVLVSDRSPTASKSASSTKGSVARGRCARPSMPRNSLQDTGTLSWTGWSSEEGHGGLPVITLVTLAGSTHSGRYWLALLRNS